MLSSLFQLAIPLAESCYSEIQIPFIFRLSGLGGCIRTSTWKPQRKLWYVLFFFLLFIDIIERLSDAGSISTLGPNSSGGPQEGEIGHQGGTF